MRKPKTIPTQPFTTTEFLIATALIIIVPLMVFTIILYSAGAGRFREVDSTTPTPTPTSTYPTPAYVPPPAAPPVVIVGDSVTVHRVIDGDTFETHDGRKVRVLGIDSCESNTDGGDAATADAQRLLAGNVTLTAEPGVDTDRYGRELRYVQVNGLDFGMEMVVKDHTAVYDGRNDASAIYMIGLFAADLNGRTCDEAPPLAVRVPTPDSQRTGNSGHPCLPGERDGDGDGYCGEG